MDYLAKSILDYKLTFPPPHSQEYSPMSLVFDIFDRFNGSLYHHIRFSPVVLGNNLTLMGFPNHFPSFYITDSPLRVRQLQLLMGRFIGIVNYSILKFRVF